ncbi:MAG: OmpA family protein [Ignavibacteriales bacterium]|nr:OmpA family protein [Ignavibacteriales bacterium]
MKKIIYLLVVLGLVAMSQPNYAQFKDWGTKFGFRGSILFPENEFANLGFSGNDNFSFDWFKTSWLGEGYFAVELNNALEMSLNAGYGKYAGLAYMDNINTGFGEYESSIIPISLRFKVSPFDSKGWNPYAFIGGGIMHYSIDTKPSIFGKPIEEDGWVAILPIGVGIEVALGERVLLDFGLGGALSSTYYLDGYRALSEDSWDSYYNVSLGLTFTGENCKSDKDNDGLGKCLEQQIGTDPNNPDTDGDGLNDGEEYLTYKTNPLIADTDGDGLGDANEVKVTKTDPLIPDTDNDGLKDGEEVNKYKTDPLKADTDGDGLKDGDEVLKYKTNPLKADTDGEGLTDGKEVNGINVEIKVVGNPVITKLFKTDPLKVDTDGDGLTDYAEVNTHKTDPLNVDTDGGTIDDGTEVKRGTDPLDPSDDIIKINVPIVLEGITFAFNKSEITPESDNVLMGALKTLKTYPDIIVEISGHTDNVGSNAYNQKLSQRRADAVKAWLVAKGIPSERITSVGYGEEHPRVANDTEDNMRLNRRIEFKRIK